MRNTYIRLENLMAGASRHKSVWLIAVLVLAASVTTLGKGYQLFQATMLLSYVVAPLGLNILTGYNGQISLGHGAFYAIGAYGTAILMDRFGLPYWAVVPAAGLIAFVVGYLFGWPALKLEGVYLALATFALGVAMPQLLKYRHFEGWTGGVQGITVLKPEAPFSLPFSADQWLFLFALTVVVLAFWLAHNMLSGGTGRAMRAIRDDTLASEAMGVDVRTIKATTFGISAAFTAIGGGLSALAVQFVAPDSFSMFLSISLLVGMVVGGVGTLWGPVFGGVFIMVVPTVAEQVSKAAPWAVYGIILILCMFVMPGGVIGLLNKARARLLRS